MPHLPGAGRLDDPGAALRGVAEARWAAERAAATGEDAAAVAAEAATWKGAAAQRRGRELARITAALKREIARADATSRLADLLAPGARERVDALRAAGVRTVVLDECHHLASLWGYVVRAVLEELGDGVHVVGLTATPPDELTTEEAELYAALLGPVDFQVPTPAVVRDGYLAPYQELAWLTEPLDGEQRWLDEHETRFRELVTGLLDVDEGGPLDLGQWVITRLRHRTRPGEDESEVPWSDFQRRHPALAARRRALPRVRGPAAAAGRAARRGLPAPAGPRRLGRAAGGLGAALPRRPARARGGRAARRGRSGAARPRLPADAHRDPPRGVRRRPAADGLGREAARARRGARRRGRDARDRPARARPLRRRARRRAARRRAARRARPDAGTARAAVRALAEDARTAVLRPLLVSGRGLRCAEADADALLAARCGKPATPARTTAARARPPDGLVELRGPGDWRPRRWVGLATAIFDAGTRARSSGRARSSARAGTRPA